MCGSGPSQAEQTAQQQAAAESQALFTQYQQQFGQENSFVNNFLKPQLESLYTNPTGFGAAALADLDASLINTTGAQAANARQAENANFATNNMAGLPSGVNAAIQSQINSAAGNTVATGQNQINLANQQYKNQQQMTALSGLQNIPAMLGASPQVGGLLTGANQNAFNQANTINQQSIAGDFWGNLGQGLLGGLINGAAGALTGGLTTMGQIGGTMFSMAGGGQGNANLGNPGFTGAPVASSPIPDSIPLVSGPF
jgi:hypothetical protein